uniref:Small ribosomal subunit protein uS10m n=1 Tax=Mus spicilegus TaxID=10103 RepID=A0A8C6IJ29_MUSSI
MAARAVCVALCRRLQQRLNPGPCLHQTKVLPLKPICSLLWDSSGLLGLPSHHSSLDIVPDGTTHAALEDSTEHQMENESRKVLSNIMELGNSSINGSKSGTTRAGGLALSASMKWVPLSNLHVDVPKDVTRPTITTSDEPDTLYKRLSILVKAHDRAVLDSYEYFAVLAAKELGISIKVHEPPRKIERFTLLKSVHIFKKHRVQYEMRTLYRCLELKHLTGSTASVYLEYIQRNLPEGVAMEVTKTQIQQLPEHIKEPMWETVPEEKEESKS